MLTLLVALPLLTLTIAISPWPFAALSVVTLGISTAVTLRAEDGGDGRMLDQRRLFLGVTLALASILGLYLLARPTIWMAAETLETKSHGTLVGYVVASDSNWTTILTPTWTNQLEAGANSLVRIPTTDVGTRTLCAFDFEDARAFGRKLRVRAFELPGLLFGNDSIEALTPACPTS